MSEKIIDPMGLLGQVDRNADPKLKRLFEKRVEEEFEAEQAEARMKAVTAGAPPLPQAELVYCGASNLMGVAVKGFPFVCQLPKGYSGPGMELAAIEGDRLIVTHPNHPPLLICPQTGTTRRL